MAQDRGTKRRAVSMGSSESVDASGTQPPRRWGVSNKATATSGRQRLGAGLRVMLSIQWMGLAPPTVPVQSPWAHDQTPRPEGAQLTGKREAGRSGLVNAMHRRCGLAPLGHPCQHNVAVVMPSAGFSPSPGTNRAATWHTRGVDPQKHFLSLNGSRRGRVPCFASLHSLRRCC